MKQRREITDTDEVLFVDDAAIKRRVQKRLLTWFSKNARDLPWRRTQDPYHVWVSEIMLQQTQVATVIGYFERFVERFPSIPNLAASPEQEVLRLWEGLGYYRRARQLHQAARQIVAEHNGKFPQDFQQVRALPGIGRYTAGAILSIALEQRHPILEANTIRVFSRLVAFRGDPQRSAGQRHLWSVAEAMLPRNKVGQHNQALMEVGSKVCSPRQPACPECPMMDLCATFKHGLQDEIPAPKTKAKYVRLREAAVVIRRNGRVLVRHCQPGERWAGLWDFPRFEIGESNGVELEEAMVRSVTKLTGLSIVPVRKLASFDHSVTKYRIHLVCYEASCMKTVRRDDRQFWVKLSELDGLPLSVTGRRIAKILEQQGREKSSV